MVRGYLEVNLLLNKEFIHHLYRDYHLKDFPFNMQKYLKDFESKEPELFSQWKEMKELKDKFEKNLLDRHDAKIKELSDGRVTI
jgi:hypothetical protein